jgi:hypothetical protein
VRVLFSTVTVLLSDPTTLTRASASTAVVLLSERTRAVYETDVETGSYTPSTTDEPDVDHAAAYVEAPTKATAAAPDDDATALDTDPAVDPTPDTVAVPDDDALAAAVDAPTPTTDDVPSAAPAPDVALPEL